jgi:hypothetical protein
MEEQEMTETEVKIPTDIKPFELIGQMIDQIYEWSTAELGQPIGLHLFDDQLAEALDLAWSLQQVCPHVVMEEELKQLVDGEYIKTWTSPKGGRGFLLYTPEQVKTFKALRELGRYSDDELKHIMANWNADIECTLEVLPYDDPEIPDFEHVRRNVEEHIAETKRQISYLDEPSDLSIEECSKRSDGFKEELWKWNRVAQRLDSWNPAALTREMSRYIERSLFRMRWTDEWIRIGNAERFRTAILKGYSPEVFFRSHSHGPGGFTFGDIDWALTLRAFGQNRSEGKIFPLRTPDFDLVKRGMILHKPLTPDDYAELCKRYQIGEMGRVMDELGPNLWNPPTRPGSNDICPECGNSFPRTLAAKRYCSGKCRSRAKQRRYRERDPERARLSQARYWKSYTIVPINDFACLTQQRRGFD